ncbi:AAA family ATPase [Cohnella yongneupensis]|uniref:AAA family ATPase n=1 Tax=Cohnella yongneupensis TaxID=425006 RepID=A0ABW0R1A2_9BACL
MARADLLKTLIRSFKQNDKESFVKAAEYIIDEEKKKNHLVLADELKRILYSEQTNIQKSISVFQPITPPKDLDKNINLYEIKFPDRFFRDLVVNEMVENDLQSVIRDFQYWDTLVSNGIKPNNKILFCGPPGCGKTLAAEAIAGELGLPMLYVRFDAVISSFLGETSNNLRKLFEYASSNSWVIFFDEFDAIGRSREDESEHGEVKRVVNAFLQLIDSFAGRSLIIAATNYEKVIDNALWRRFSEVVQFELPNHAQIQILLKRNLNRFHGPENKLRELVDELIGFSHAEIERICQSIVKQCIFDNRDYFTQKDIERSYVKELRRKQARIANNTGG